MNTVVKLLPYRTLIKEDTNMEFQEHRASNKVCRGYRLTSHYLIDITDPEGYTNTETILSNPYLELLNNRTAIILKFKGN